LRVEEEPSRSHEGLFAFASGVGAHEVIIESASHDKDWFDFSTQELWEILLCWRERLLDLRRDKRLRHAVIVRSVGLSPSAPSHPHSQIIALPFFAPQLSRKMEGARRYFEEHDRCAFCDLISEESKRELRVVLANDDMIALAPYASRRPFELWLSLRRHLASFEGTEPQLLLAFAAVLRGTLQRLARALDRPVYSVALHSAPYVEAHSASFHWHLEISPALAPSHALESFGCAVNPTAPETVAAFLREVIV
jgi:UDPglucose--hexose-1-phosphate uridylyltransferase